MFLFRNLLPFFVFFAAPLAAFAGGEAHGVPNKATEIFKIGDFPVTNSMLMAWIVALLIIVGVKIAVGRPKLIPSRGQTAVEGVLEYLRDTLEPIVGKRVIKPAFPLLAGFFFYILLMNWSGLIPGVGTVGAWVGTGDARHFEDFFRPANSDLNSTLALALISFCGWIYFVLRYAGLRAFWHETFGNKADRNEVPLPVYWFMTVLFLGVGIIESISILFRPVSLAFRLYGNVFGGENLLHNLSGLSPYLVPAAGYVLEFLVGLIQAFVFTLLSAVYIGLICNHGDEEHAENAGGKTLPVH